VRVTKLVELDQKNITALPCSHKIESNGKVAPRFSTMGWDGGGEVGRVASRSMRDWHEIKDSREMMAAKHSQYEYQATKHSKTRCNLQRRTTRSGCRGRA
jgi:hypothetical protein